MQNLNQTPRALVDAARELVRAGRLGEAIDLHEKAVAKDPQFTQAWVNLVSLYGRSQEAAKAKAAYVRVPDNAEANYNYGVFCFGTEDWACAKDAFEKAVARDPNYAEALNNLGAVYERLGQLDRASDSFHRALKVDNRYPLAHFHLGRIYANQHKFAQAIAEFEQSLEPAGDQTPSFLYALGATCARAGQRERAIEWMTRARREALTRGQQALIAGIDRDLARLRASPR